MTYDLATADDLDESYHDLCIRMEIIEVEKCPLCDINMSPGMLCVLDGDNCYFIVLECPKCHSVFMHKWDFSLESSEVYPKQGVSRTFELCIQDLSQNFVKTYNQSIIAESQALDEIAGMGYRKSLEYLIKDYLISSHNDKKDQIRKLFLGKCIDTYVENDKIKGMAKRATWLGNDEAHYEKRWVDKDINDLKALIDITLYWITYELKTEEYKKIMQE